jgi:hypothetical protein
VDFSSASGVPEIVFPEDGAVFFFDPTLPAKHQSITVSLRGSGGSTLYYDGQPYPVDRLPAALSLPVERGRHELSLEGGNTVFFRVE